MTQWRRVSSFWRAREMRRREDAAPRDRRRLSGRIHRGSRSRSRRRAPRRSNARTSPALHVDREERGTVEGVVDAELLPEFSEAPIANRELRPHLRGARRAREIDVAGHVPPANRPRMSWSSTFDSSERIRAVRSSKASRFATRRSAATVTSSATLRNASNASGRSLNKRPVGCVLRPEISEIENARTELGSERLPLAEPNGAIAGHVAPVGHERDRKRVICIEWSSANPQPLDLRRRMPARRLVPELDGGIVHADLRKVPALLSPVFRPERPIAAPVRVCLEDDVGVPESDAVDLDTASNEREGVERQFGAPRAHHVRNGARGEVSEDDFGGGEDWRQRRLECDTTRNRYPSTGRRSERLPNLGLEAVPVDDARRENRDEEHDRDENCAGEEPRSPPSGMASAPVCHGGLSNSREGASFDSESRATLCPIAR